MAVEEGIACAVQAVTLTSCSLITLFCSVSYNDIVILLMIMSSIRNIFNMTICLIWFQNKCSNFKKKVDNFQNE